MLAVSFPSPLTACSFGSGGSAQVAAVVCPNSRCLLPDWTDAPLYGPHDLRPSTPWTTRFCGQAPHTYGPHVCGMTPLLGPAIVARSLRLQTSEISSAWLLRAACMRMVRRTTVNTVQLMTGRAEQISLST
uniref:uncharacterized protein isoform X3 n=1 Tax=Myxine glutinosa TaxID=7769 RepID=UPI00358E9ACA